MTVENFLRGVVTDSLPNFNGNIHDANGMSFPEFLSEKSTETPSIFISYEGFSDVEYYSDGSGNVLTENYSLYIRCNDSVKTHVKALMVALGGEYSEFTDDDGAIKYVQIISGQTFRDNGADAFEITLQIK